jgi:hypothetical protein
LLLISSAASTVPMLEDCAMTPAIVSRSVGCPNQSLIVSDSRCSSDGTVILVRGVTRPASTSADAVSAFCTLPGS